MDDVAQRQTGLPVCSLRAETNEPLVFYCRHSQVHAPDNLVTSEVCQVCSVYAAPCPNPRPLADEGGRLPVWYQRAWNVTASLAAFVSDGMTMVSEDQYQQRLRICDDCRHRKGNTCRRCGCLLSLKARGRAFDCPVRKWPEL